jgi:hypothetical protein
VILAKRDKKHWNKHKNAINSDPDIPTKREKENNEQKKILQGRYISGSRFDIECSFPCYRVYKEQYGGE